jgi:hypothetical protein
VASTRSSHPILAAKLSFRSAATNNRWPMGNITGMEDDAVVVVAEAFALPLLVSVVGGAPIVAAGDATVVGGITVTIT